MPRLISNKTAFFYRQGTWTPVLSDDDATDENASVHTGTPQYQVGWYERVGDVVTVTWYYQAPSASFSYTNGSNGTGHLRFVGLPFKIANETAYYPVASCGYFAGWGSWSASYTPMGLGFPNTNRMACYYAVANGVGELPSTHHSTQNASSIWSMTYRTEDA